MNKLLRYCFYVASLSGLGVLAVLWESKFTILIFGAICVFQAIVLTGLFLDDMAEEEEFWKENLKQGERGEWETRLK